MSTSVKPGFVKKAHSTVCQTHFTALYRLSTALFRLRNALSSADLSALGNPCYNAACTRDERADRRQDGRAAGALRGGRRVRIHSIFSILYSKFCAGKEMSLERRFEKTNPIRRNIPP